ncbi:MAG: L,D-transpeptidase [Ignavibacteria bacterium]|nr:L,D-transpeptidase [Ignavibacteria bacterium]MBT8383216.1 L,D-transpeptidase [Ignavibacteria bacterium]MBT8392173.1 L,D-transpeptidase [Ignavibacteria bacterium]NNJ53833.1 L,D-transpeptidase [Ignavibacteriaceae bacterium]NNL20516.1 L,D-transpeptidase [Ignavibacteriaceae bacterium]
MFEKLKKKNLGPIQVSDYINIGIARNILFLTGAILLFIACSLLYGFILSEIRAVPVSEAMYKKGYTELKNPNIIINRHNYTLSLYEDSVLIKDYRANFGKSVSAPKSRAGDNSTPVGEYQICGIDTAHKYHKFFQINYPNLKDAANALRKGWISQKEYNEIKFQYYYEGCIENNRVLGGNLGIQGIGKFNFIIKNLPFVFNWTNGSIALSDEDIDEIFSIVKIGTKVVIK